MLRGHSSQTKLRESLAFREVRVRWNKNKFALGNNRVPAREKEKQRDGVLNPNAWKANMIARRTPGEYLVLRTKHSDT